MYNIICTDWRAGPNTVRGSKAELLLTNNSALWVNKAKYLYLCLCKITRDFKRKQSKTVKEKERGTTHIPRSASSVSSSNNEDAILLPPGSWSKKSSLKSSRGLCKLAFERSVNSAVLVTSQRKAKWASSYGGLK